METYSSRRRRSTPKSVKLQGDEPTLDDLVEAASIMTDKREEKVKRVFFHQGVFLGTSVPNSVDREKDHAEIVMCHHGVRVTIKDRHFIVPISVITSIELFAPGQ